MFGFIERHMLPVFMSNILAIGATVAFDVDIKTIMAVITLVVTQLWVGIRWGMKIEKGQIYLDNRLTEIDRALKVLNVNNGSTESIRDAVRIGIEEALLAQDKRISYHASKATGGL